MHEGPGDCAFADGRGHALDVAAADVAHGEDAGQAGLEPAIGGAGGDVTVRAGTVTSSSISTLYGRRA